MSEEQSDKAQYFGAPLEDYPELCRSCLRMAALVLRAGNPDLTNLSGYPLPQTEDHHLARIVFSRLDGCSGDLCGLSAYAVQPDADLK